MRNPQSANGLIEAITRMVLEKVKVWIHNEYRPNLTRGIGTAPGAGGAAPAGTGEETSSFKARPAADQTVTTSSSQVALSVADVNVGSHFDTTAHGWTPPAGRVVVGGHVYGTSTGHTLWAQILKNGTEIGRSKVAFETNAAFGTTAEVVVLDSASGTDRYTLNVYGSSASFTPLLGAAGTYMWGHLLTVDGGGSGGTGPAGPPGATGPPGPTGPPGADGLPNPMTAVGDVIVGAASGTPARLGIGATAQILTVVGGTPAWQPPAAGGMTNPMTLQDDLIIGGASGAPARLGKGTDGQVLTVDPATHHLSWAAPAPSTGVAVGLVPYALPIGLTPTATAGVIQTMPATGGTMLTPFTITSSMSVDSVSWRSGDTSGTHTWEWRLYREPAGGSSILNDVPGANGSESFSPSGPSVRTAVCAGTVVISPGTYWVALRNSDAVSTLVLFGVVTGAGAMAMGLTTTQSRASQAALGATIDANAAGWNKSAAVPAMRLNGRVIGQGVAW
jgi:hypothetical protein